MNGDEWAVAEDTPAASDQVFEPTERVFACVTCGFTTTRGVPRRQHETQSVCTNCGDWTTHLADQEIIVEDANVATALDGPTLTERQALAHVLRDVVGLDRQLTADVRDTSASNVDNPPRKAVE